MEELIHVLRAAARSVRADLDRWEADRIDRLSKMDPVLVDWSAGPEAGSGAGPRIGDDWDLNIEIAPEDAGGTGRPAHVSIPMLALFRPMALRMTKLTLELPVVVEEHPSPDDPNDTVLSLGAAEGAPQNAKLFRLALELVEDGTVDVSLEGQLLDSFKDDAGEGAKEGGHEQR
ncbi:hypothetical protein [Azospirillum rugosum]|uniref:Uncharacterized protein n=1 Tax=Azospirillum rugosum TaxID=416170 RepID=A0ABS4SYD3_9PROT|nr:hypothetical protein [Azospirillum rugosum]MBP2297007.1 hypothetical protein [Azospirillum rugosum]MDQ0530639.1 hypothetical protein [Azospirillum rugosum]